MSGFIVPRLGGYHVERKIGSGSSGLVYSAIQEETNLDVVIKVVSFSNPWLQREFERELKNLTLLGASPYLVKMYDHFEQKTQGIIILERMKGDLLDYMETKQLSEVDVKKIFYQVCKGVEHAHSHNVAHMDIKPENIFLNDVHNVKLADFGSSCVWKAGSPSVIFGQIGTQFYCAPEVRPNQPFEATKGDIWSLGILLYVLLTGYWPYSGTTQKEAKRNVEIGKTDFLLDKIPSDEHFLQLLYSMLNTVPQERPTIQEVLMNPWVLHGLEPEFLFGSMATSEKIVYSMSALSLPKSSSEPDIAEVSAVTVPRPKSPRRKRTSIKEDDQIRDTVASVLEEIPKKRKKKRWQQAVISLIGKLK